MGWFRDLGRGKPWAQGCVIFGAGFVLALTSCFGAIFALDGPAGSPTMVLGYALIGLFFLGLIALPVGFVWWIVGLVKNAHRPVAAPPAPIAAPAPPATPEGPADPGQGRV